MVTPAAGVWYHGVSLLLNGKLFGSLSGFEGMLVVVGLRGYMMLQVPRESRFKR